MTTVAQPPTASKISLVLAHQVADALKMAQLGNDSLMRALDRALALMEQGHYMELRGNVLRIASASQEGVTYATMINECPCRAEQGVCFHRAALAILMGIQTIQAAAQLCQPLVAKPSRARTARPALAGVEVRAVTQSSRTSRGPMSDDEYRRACAAADDMF